MPRSSFASLALLTSSTLLLSLGCDQGSTSSTSNGGTGSASGGSATTGGSAVGLAGHESGGGSGVTGGTTFVAGASGSASGGGTTSVGGSTATGGTAGAGGAVGGGGSTTGPSGSCVGALVCEDFESYTGTPGGPWKVDKNGAGNVVIDGAQHQSGTKAVKFTTTGSDSYQRAYIGLDKIFPVANNAFYGRMMIYVTKAANDGVHWSMIQGEGPATSQGISSAKVRYGGQHMQRLMANYDSSGKASDCWQHSQTVMPEAKWACMEWYFEGATNTQKFWLDGHALDDLTVTGKGEGCVSHDTDDNWYYPSFEHLYLGWESYQTDDPREVWIDDVAINTTQIGCPK